MADTKQDVAKVPIIGERNLYPSQLARLEADNAALLARLEGAKLRAKAWEETAQQHARNEAFYRGLIEQIGDLFGVAAKTADDGSVMEDILALRVPELVKAERAEHQRAVEALRKVSIEKVLDGNLELLYRHCLICNPQYDAQVKFLAEKRLGFWWHDESECHDAINGHPCPARPWEGR